LYYKGLVKDYLKPEIAEAKAIQFALLMAHEEKLESIVIEGDNKYFLDAIRGDNQ
jgi:ribonuclease HI